MLKDLARAALSPSWLAKIAAKSVRIPIIVLAYHDLRALGDPQSWLRVNVESFRDHVRTLRTVGTFIRPSHLAEPHSLRGPGPYFLLTFDDGYANNLTLGVPVLEAFDVHAIHFISTDNLLTGQPFWFDRAANPILATRIRRLDLREVGLSVYEFVSIAEERDWTPIQRLLTDIKQLGDAGDPRVEAVLALIESRCGGDPLRERFRPITVAELKTLSTSACCSVGSHGHRHVFLTRLDDVALQQELTVSRRILEETTGKSASALSYPNGTYDSRVSKACAGAGYQRAYTTKAGVCDVFDGSPWQLPRLLVGGFDTTRKLIALVNRLLTSTAWHRWRSRTDVQEPSSAADF